MTAAVNDRSQANPRILAANIKSAHAFGAVDLMRRERNQIRARALDVERDFSDGLNGVGMEENALFFADFGDFRDRVDRADFVIGEHHGNQDRAAAYRLTHIFSAYAAILIDRKIGDLEALGLKIMASIQNGLMLDGRRDDVIAFFFVHLGYTDQGEIVTLGRAAGEDDFFFVRADELCDLATGMLDGASAVQPNSWLRLAALPKISVKYGSIVLRTSGSTGVVA